MRYWRAKPDNFCARSLPECRPDFLRCPFECFFGEFQFFPAEVDITYVVYRDEMNVCMRDFQSQHRNTNALAFYRLIDGARDSLCKYHHAAQEIILQIEKVIYFFFGNYQGMPLGQGVYIQEGIVVLILGYFIRRDLTVYDSGKNSCHVMRI